MRNRLKYNHMERAREEERERESDSQVQVRLMNEQKLNEEEIKIIAYSKRRKV